MEVLWFILSAVVLVVAIVLFWRSRRSAPRMDTDQAFLNLQQDINNLRNQVNASLGSVGTIASGMLRTQTATTERLTRLEQAAQSMIEVGKDISSLQDILKPPQLRGALGETLLENLLACYLPDDSFKIKYQFADGTQVDSVVVLPSGMVPVDAKFPLDSFRRIQAASDDAEKQQCRKEFVRDVKKHIDDISQKYILPDEGTLGFALAYIPAENVYYETIIRDEAGDNIAEYARARHVVPVSPSTLFAHLQLIAMGLKGMRVEQFAQEILKDLGRLQQDFDRIQEEYRVLGTHLHNASQKYGDAGRRMERFGDKLSRIEAPSAAEALAEGVEPPYLSSPAHGDGEETENTERDIG
jgi:DNA recombination protein RmuC